MNEINKQNKKNGDNDRTKLGMLKSVYKFAKTYMKHNTNLPYHNFPHALDFGHAFLRYAKIYGLSDEDRFIGLTIALTHDLKVTPAAGDEEITAKLVEMVLPNFGYNIPQTMRVADGIRATMPGYVPKTLMEEIIRDSDVDNLGREDCIDLGDKVMEEYGVPAGMARRKAQLKFMSEIHEWHTDAAKMLRGYGKQQNIAKLDRIVNRGTYTTQELNRNAYKTA